VGIDNPVHILFLAAVALVVLGPKRLPELARAAGKSMREFREALNGGVVEESHSGQVVQQEIGAQVMQQEVAPGDSILPQAPVAAQAPGLPPRIPAGSEGVRQDPIANDR
jgi:sec-independent protein translocase protein TatA